MDDRKQFRALLETGRDLTAVVDEDGVVRYVNAVAKRLLGYEPTELVGTDGFEHVHPSDAPHLRTALDAAIDNPTTTAVDAEFRVRTAEGSWSRLAGEFSAEQDPALGGYVVTARAVPEPRGANGSHERGRDPLHELAETSNEVLWMFTAGWDELLFVNSAYERIWGRSVDDLRENPRDFLDGVHPADHDRVEQAMERLSNGTAVDIEYRVNEAADYSHWVWVQGEPVVEGEDVVRVVGFARDVSERHERTRQLQVIDRLLRHNLRNSMNIILGYATELDGSLASDARQPVDRLQEEGERLLALADKQRELVDVLTTEVQSNRVDFGQVVQETVETVELDYPECRITTRIEEPAAVLAFPKIDLAVRELVVNALEHCDGENPTVTVTVRTVEETVTLEVRDRNPPIPAQNTTVLTGEREIEELFHGEGVGLWLVYWLFERSNGAVTFAKNEPCGNCVRGMLPCAERS